MRTEIQIFNDFIREKGHKNSKKRNYILRAFLKSNAHVSAEDLYERVHSKRPGIGYTTVYRTMKLIAESGLAGTVDFEDGVKRYEKKTGRGFHAHYICTTCGVSFEVFNKQIRELGEKTLKERKFHPSKYRFEIFGLCQKCQ